MKLIQKKIQISTNKTTIVIQIRPLTTLYQVKNINWKEIKIFKNK